ncbi:uncharacterized protein LOC129571161, partial [Sitodiplosis mosellana]|uniref:uncharacterized protein LOC129571161 n=1 Tax=Sitodiplosis mosellana TaxID=263140 RepID=UPI0024451CAA
MDALLEATQCIICTDNLNKRCPLCRAYIWIFNIRPFFLPGLQRLIEGLQPRRQIPQNPILARHGLHMRSIPTGHGHLPIAPNQNQNQRQQAQNENRPVRDAGGILRNVNQRAPVGAIVAQNVNRVREAAPRVRENRHVPTEPNIAQARRHRLYPLPVLNQRIELQGNHDRQRNQPQPLRYERRMCLICGHFFTAVDNNV